MDNAFLLSGARTPLGALGGAFASTPAPELGAVALRAAIERAKIQPQDLDEVIMGNVVGAGLGQNPARQAAIKSGVPVSVGAVTINKVCGSGLKAVMLAEQAIRAGDAHLVAAGGMENMTLAPYLLPRARQGYRLGHGQVLDAMIHDGLWDAYGHQPMGVYGDQCAVQHHLTKQEQDDFAVRSFTRARQAQQQGVFEAEIAPVVVKTKHGDTIVSHDESLERFHEEKLRQLTPAFDVAGTVTAGNASSINDGAAAVVVASGKRCADAGLKPLARIVASTTFSQQPERFTTAPLGALVKLLDKVQWSVEATDLFEINEAFAAVALVAERHLNIPPEKVNIYGGAIALGHPIGASGARILVTLLTALRLTGGRRGVACLCIGGGEAVAMAVERVSDLSD